MLGSSHLHNFGSPSYDFHFRIGLFIFSTLCHLVILSFFFGPFGALSADVATPQQQFYCSLAATPPKMCTGSRPGHPCGLVLFVLFVLPLTGVVWPAFCCALFFSAAFIFCCWFLFFFFVYCPHFVLVDFCCSLHVRALFHNFFVALFMRIKNKLKSDQK